MKNKKAVYVLFPLLIAVWGTIAYKIFSAGSSDNNIIPQNNFSMPKIENTGFDTFSISANYRDPFLEKSVVIDKKQDIPKIKTPKPEIKADIPWPAITYGGMIKNQRSSKQLYMVQVNGSDNIAKEGDMISGVQLTKAWKDSIQIMFQKKKKVIKK